MTKTAGLITLGLLCVLTAAYGGSFDSEEYRSQQEERANEKKLQKKAKFINLKPSSEELDKGRALALSGHYGILYSRLIEIRRQGMGWGDITASLALADRLSTFSPSPLMMDEAFEKILALTQQGLGWAEITRSYGFSINPVLRSMRLGEKSIKKADQMVMENELKRAKVKDTAEVKHKQQMEQFESQRRETPAPKPVNPQWREPQTP